MGRRGPPPKLTRDKILAGNPGKRQINAQEPDFDAGATMPATVASDPIARAEWERLAPELIAKKVLTAQDQTEFAEYCLQHSDCEGLWKEIKNVGYERAVMAGLWKARQGAVAARARLAARFGFTPADRSQVRIPDKAQEPKGAGRFLALVK